MNGQVKIDDLTVDKDLSMDEMIQILAYDSCVSFSIKKNIPTKAPQTQMTPKQSND